VNSKRKNRRLSVAIPASIVSDTPHLREKTGKLGSIARACSIFGVSDIVLYVDDARRGQEADLALCDEILGFAETPQYLRKRLFRLTANLRFTGILAPLQTPPHNVPRSIQESNVGDIRDGVVVGRHEASLLVDAGLGTDIQCRGELPLSKRVTVKVIALGKNPKGEIVDSSNDSQFYWGYDIIKADSGLGKFIEEEEFDVAIGTSRYGSPLAEFWPNLVYSFRSAERVLVAFGSPKMGLTDILQGENKVPDDVFDYFLNAVPNQNVSTVRTEEAIFISLGIFNLATSIY
jgi:predicted SPOUT superfamily RNA methylase MTH1